MTDNFLSDIITDGARRLPPTDFIVHGTGQQLERNKYVTSSECGYCERMIWFKKNVEEVVPPEGYLKPLQDGYGIMARGNTAEQWIVDCLRAAHTAVRFFYIGDEQRSFVVDRQSGTPDGIAVLPDDRALLLEFKSIDPRTNVRYLPKKPHVMQVTQNIDLMLEKTDFNIVGGVLLYINAADYGKRYEFPIEFDEHEAERLEARAARIMQAQSASEMKPEGMFGTDCKFCDFKQQCSKVNDNDGSSQDRAGTAGAFFG